jgi:methionyl aminopeptidase
MIQLKSDKDIQGIAESGKIAVLISEELKRAIKPGISLKDLEKIAEEFFKRYNAKPAFLGFRPGGAEKPFPYFICTSVNEVVVHGQPTNYQLKEGDILKIDLGVILNNYYSDTAFTVGVGKITPVAKKLIKATQEALNRAIAVAKPNNTLGDLGFTIEKTADLYGFSVIKVLAGHGVGFSLHEDPMVYNFGERDKGLVLKSGMVLAIEPMLTVGDGRIKKQKDDSYATVDKSLSAHFEHTIAITKKGAKVLTRL